MHRFYLPPELCRGATLRLEDREAHHALHVLRLKRGSPATVLDGAGSEFFCEVENTGKDSLTLAVKEKKTHPAPVCPVSLFVAIPKGKIFEDIIPKAVELGASRIVPLLTERVVTQLDREGAEAKREKWQQVAVEAIKQCGAAWLPRVEAPVNLKELLTGASSAKNSPFPSGMEPAHNAANLSPSPRLAGEEGPNGERAGVRCAPHQIQSAAGMKGLGELPEFTLVGSLQTERKHPSVWLEQFQQQHGRKPHSAGAWIGPEGDFTLAELQAIEAAGAKPITLGPLTLRVETAAIYCLSFLNYELQRD